MYLVIQVQLDNLLRGISEQLQFFHENLKSVQYCIWIKVCLKKPLDKFNLKKKRAEFSELELDTFL